MRRVLIVAYYFPPLGGIGSVRAHGFATHLPDYGWQPTVLAPRDGAYFRDPELSFPEERVLRTRSIELSRAGKRMLRAGGADTVPAEVTGARAAVRSIARAALYFPDAQVGWYPSAVVEARHALKGHSFDAIFSSSFPITAHLVARRLARWMKIPWVAEFRDPWSQMLVHQERPSGRAARLECALAREAAARVMTSPSWADAHARLWGREVSVIPNGHDGTIAQPNVDGATTIAYLGTFYPQTQSLTAVWDAVAAINRSEEPVRLRFVGELHPALGRELRDRGLDSALEVTGFLPHKEALVALARSSLLLVAGPSEASGLLRGQVVAKLPEYLATDLPVLYVGDPSADAAEMMRGLPGAEIVATDDVEGVATAIRRQRGHRYQRGVDHLSRRSLTGQLAEILEDACSRRDVGSDV